MCSCSVNDDRRRRRPGRLNTGTSWFRYGGAIPCKVHDNVVQNLNYDVWKWLVKQECLWLSPEWKDRRCRCTSSGRVFLKMEAATGNKRRPAVDRRAAAAWTTILIRWRHTVQHSVCHERQFKVDPFWQTQPVLNREGVKYVVVATKWKYQASCGVEYGLL